MPLFIKVICNYVLGEIMHVVLSIGGSALMPGNKPNLKLIKELSKIFAKSRNDFAVVVGGGPPARAYANAARELGASEFDADSIAIMSTKQNAKLLLSALGDMAPSDVIHDFEEAREAAKAYKVVVMGGTIPGITTDTDSVLLAEAIGAKRLVNVSNVSGIFESDPKKSKNAKKFDKMGYDQLVSLAIGSDKRIAGTNFVFDLLACKLIARSGIETHFVSWKNTKEIGAAIEGKKHNGTIVR
jgi:uridylate kinase